MTITKWNYAIIDAVLQTRMVNEKCLGAINKWNDVIKDRLLQS